MDNKKSTDVSLNKSNQPSKIFIFGLFEKDNPLLFVYKKAEKIASAFYLVSNFLSDNEPIKWQFRSIGLSITSQVLSLNIESLSRSEGVSKMTLDILKMLSFLEVAFVAGFVSEMNFIILKNELENFLETLNFKLDTRHDKSAYPITFNKDFFAVPQDIFIPETKTSNFSKGHDKGQQIIKDKTFSGPAERSGVHTGRHKGHKNNATLGNEREAIIINLLKSKNNLTIKDFSLVIKGCSEKTIQRELLRLVHGGVLNKVGERRWSRYSLTVS